MGLLSRPAADNNASSKTSCESRWLFPLRRFEEEFLEHILMSASSAPWSGRHSKDDIIARRRKDDSGQQISAKERPMKDLVQRKIEKLGRNVAEKVKTLKQVLAETLDRGSEREQCARRDECRKVACNEIVQATLQRHPGSQLPDVFVSNLQAHFDALPISYARAGFNSEQVFMHIRLLEQVKVQRLNTPVVHLQPADCMSRSGNVSEFSSTSSSPSSSVWEENERGVSEEVIDVAFACSSVVSRAALIWAFEHEMIIVRHVSVFERKGNCLCVLVIQTSREKTQQEFVGRVIKSAMRTSKFSKFSLGLCGCEVPGFSERETRSAGSRKEITTVSSVDDDAEFKESYWNEADFNFTSTSFMNTGYEYGCYGYPCLEEPHLLWDFDYLTDGTSPKLSPEL